MGVRRVRHRRLHRRVMTWQVATHLRTGLALGALQMAFWTPRREGVALTGLTHHSDKGIQYVAVRYSKRLTARGAVGSVGSAGDSYENPRRRRPTPPS